MGKDLLAQLAPSISPWPPDPASCWLPAGLSHLGSQSLQHKHSLLLTPASKALLGTSSVPDLVLLGPCPFWSEQ